MKSVKAGGLDVRYLDFKWDEAAFDAMENGGAHPAAQRSWVLARLMLQRESLKWEDSKRIPVGSALLILNPRKGGTSMSLEIRHVDMREVFTDMNVIAEPPPDETYRVAPALFEHREEGSLWETTQAAAARLTPGSTVTELISELEALQHPINAFFDKVFVMADDEAVRGNRLALLKRVADLPTGIADLTQLQGF